MCVPSNVHEIMSMRNWQKIRVLLLSTGYHSHCMGFYSKCISCLISAYVCEVSSWSTKTCSACTPIAGLMHSRPHFFLSLSLPLSVDLWKKTTKIVSSLCDERSIEKNISHPVMHMTSVKLVHSTCKLIQCMQHILGKS